MDIVANGDSTNLEPQDGLEFESNEAAYEYYKEYAQHVGFGTSKLSSRRSRPSKEFIDAKFSCSRYGNKQRSDDAINPRPSPKIGCKASMHVKRKPNGKWYIHRFVKEHNHDVSPSQAQFFRSHRKADPLKSDSKVRRKNLFAAVSKQHGEYQYVGSLENFVRNQHDRGRSLTLEEGDAQVLLELLVNMQEENPRFFYAVDLNEEHRLRNVFWVDAKGMDDYTNFGDVVSFDTMYFANKYRMPLVLFIGSNHHIQPTLLGCALIADETVYTFVWLLQTWCLSMGGRAPQVILTDHNNAIKAAVAEVLPDTRHHFCLWNVLEKVPRLLEYLSPWHDAFMAKFYKCVYQSSTEELYEKRWWKLVDRFNLREDAWFRTLYDDRKLWVPTFMRGISFAGLSTASRCESLNSFFDKYVQSETCLRDFLEQYTLVLEDRHEELAKADFDAWHETPEVKSPSPFEKQLSFVYTHEIFKKFQAEVLGASACHYKKEKDDESSITYAVKDVENNQDFMVEWCESKSDICCSCHLFEFKGYLCRHAIFVLQMSGIFTIPCKYILQRWTNAATSRYPISEKLDCVQTKIRRLNDLCRRAIILGEEGSLSQESYNIALAAIKEALIQCSSVNNSVENELRPETSAPLSNCNDGEENQDGTTGSKNQMSSVKASKTNKGSKRAESGKEKASCVSNTPKRGKVPSEQEIVNIGIQGSFHQMEIPNMRPLQFHNVMPPQITTVVPTMLHNVASSQFHNVASAQLQDACYPH